MNHKVNSVKELSEDAISLYNTLVIGTSEYSADSILNDINFAIENLQRSWEGIDAGKCINKLIDLYNSMIEIRNTLSMLSYDTSKMAYNYRHLQIINGEKLDELNIIHYEDKVKLNKYLDNKDTISISPEANIGKQRIDTVCSSIDGFISMIKRYSDDILSNWTIGTNRNKAVNSFDEFASVVEKYKVDLNDVSSSITNALNNYSF